jgi:chromosomal replication initiation ATPase DnaA
MTPVRQLALPFVHAPVFTAADFLPAPGAGAALAWLARPAGWPGGRLVLWGESGAGKTHLLHVWAGQHRATLLPAVTAHWPRGPVAVDDADLATDEHALLHLLNAAAEGRHPVLLAAQAPPARWPTRLPDLASRLRATAAVELRRSDDAFLWTLLARLLSDRQLVVTEAMQDWLLARLPRTPAAMREAAARLDRAALAAGAPVTRGLAAAALVDLIGDGAEEDGNDADAATPSLL